MKSEINKTGKTLGKILLNTTSGFMEGQFALPTGIRRSWSFPEDEKNLKDNDGRKIFNSHNFPFLISAGFGALPFVQPILWVEYPEYAIARLLGNTLSGVYELYKHYQDKGIENKNY